MKETASLGDKIKPYWLQRYEDFWPNSSNYAHTENNNS